MSHIAPGLTHVYRYSGQQDEGWRLWAGWTLGEVLDIDVRHDGSYDLTCIVNEVPGWTHATQWPPFTSEIPTEEELALLALQAEMLAPESEA